MPSGAIIKGDCMRIPMPCEFGQMSSLEKNLRFTGVHWYRWNGKWQYDYFFQAKSKWSSTHIVSSDGSAYKNFVEIPDGLFEEKRIEDHKYPFKGIGFANGLYWKKGVPMIGFQVTNRYNLIFYAECDRDVRCVLGGKYQLPPSHTDYDKIQDAFLAKYKNMYEIR